MKTYTSQSIIMRTWEVGETDLLVAFFTRDRGRLKGVAKGARKSRRRFVNCLDVFCLAQLDYFLKREGALYLLTSGRLINGYSGLRSDFGILARASYMVELTEILFPLGVAEPRMFDLLKGALHFMDEGTAPDIIPFIFEVKAMSLGGYGIALDRCCVCGRPYKGEGRAVFQRAKGGIACLKCGRESALTPGLQPQSVKILQLMQKGPLSALIKGQPGGEILNEIKPVLRLHREYHLGQRPKTASFLD